MRELTLSEIQNESLKILQDVHSFCFANGIQYSLAYGTLIGAVRHKGFIPWDDDIDIMMPRKDYDFFCRCFHSDRYKLICCDTDDSCLIGFARVCDCTNTLVRGTSWTRKDVGIWIDVFPLDNVEDNTDLFHRRYDRCRRLWQRILRNREIIGGRKDKYSAKFNILISLLNKLHLQWINSEIAKYRVHLMIQKAKSFCKKSSHLCQLVCCDDQIRSAYNAEDFDEYILHKFEDYSFNIPVGYDNILKSDYGDYLILPPENCRIPKQNDLSFYWK